MSFTDDAGNAETLTSAATAAVANAQTTTTYVSNIDQGDDSDWSDSVSRAQSFTTGSQSGGYTVASVDIGYDDAEGDKFSAAIWTVDSDNEPDDGDNNNKVADLTAPAGTWSAGDTLTFTAPTGTTLDAGTTYAVVLTMTGNAVRLDSTTSDDEDSGAFSGWSIADTGYFYSSNTWTANPTGKALRIEIKGTTAAKVDDCAGDTTTTCSMSPGSSVTGDVEMIGDFDYFRLSVTSGVTYQIDAEGSPTSMGTLTDPILYLHDITGSSSTVIAQNDDGGTGYNARLTWTADRTGTVYVVVAGTTSNTGTYTLTVSASAPDGVHAGGPDDCYPERCLRSLDMRNFDWGRTVEPSGEIVYPVRPDVRGVWSDGNTFYVIDKEYGEEVITDGWSLTEGRGYGKVVAFELKADLRGFERREESGFKLDRANINATGGFWGNDTTVWVADDAYWAQDGFYPDDDDRAAGWVAKLFAYNRSDGSRAAGEDFTTLTAAGNDHPAGIWSDGTTMWVADSQDGKLYAYRMSDRSRDAGKDFPLWKMPSGLEWAQGGGSVEEGKEWARPRGIWSDGTTMWVAGDKSAGNTHVFAYRMSNKSRDRSKEFPTRLSRGSDRVPAGVWSDGDSTMWIANPRGGLAHAVPLPGGNAPAYPEPEEVDTTGVLVKTLNVGNHPQAVWGDEHALWVIKGPTTRGRSEVPMMSLPTTRPPMSGCPTWASSCTAARTSTPAAVPGPTTRRSGSATPKPPCSLPTTSLAVPSTQTHPPPRRTSRPWTPRATIRRRASGPTATPCGWPTRTTGRSTPTGWTTTSATPTRTSN